MKICDFGSPVRSSDVPAWSKNVILGSCNKKYKRYALVTAFNGSGVPKNMVRDTKIVHLWALEANLCLIMYPGNCRELAR